jgi:RNA polymerase sigma factor (sigma-70 family)
VKMQLQKGNSSNSRAFRELLQWLDEGADSRGEKYLEMHRRLISYFGRKNCVCPNDLADQTLTRVARRLETNDPISEMPAARYCYITARYVFLEYLRGAETKQVSLDALPAFRESATGLVTPPQPEEAAQTQTRLLNRLDHCLQQLNQDQRDLIFEYYRGEQRAKIERRQALAARLGLTMNALSIRACRIREKLEVCVKTGLDREQ